MIKTTTTTTFFVAIKNYFLCVCFTEQTQTEADFWFASRKWPIVNFSLAFSAFVAKMSLQTGRVLVCVFVSNLRHVFDIFSLSTRW